MSSDGNPVDGDDWFRSKPVVDERTRHELIEQYGRGSVLLEQAWAEVPDEARHWKPSPDSWSAHEIVIHCADSETYAATRIRLLAAEPSPLIVGYDQDHWATAFTYAQLPTDLAIATIAAVRANTFHLIQRFGNETWPVVGNHTESGTYSAEDWLRTYAVHLHDHADQIRSNIRLWQVAQ